MTKNDQNDPDQQFFEGCAHDLDKNRRGDCLVCLYSSYGHDVGQYGMLGYTWVIFEKLSVLFQRDGYLFSTKFLYFFCKVGIYFAEKFCICRTR